MSEVAEVGKKRKRRRSSKGESKRKKQKTPTIEEKDVELIDPAMGITFPEKRKSDYQRFNSDQRYEIACGDSVVELSDIQKDNTELWVLQFPKNFKLSKLNGVTIDLGRNTGNSEIGKFEGENDKTFYFYDAPSKEHFKLLNIFPSSKEGETEYCLGKPFTRQVNIIESVTLPEGTTTMAPRQKVPQVTTLLPSPYHPFGCDGEVDIPSSAPIITPKKQTKKKPRRSSLGIGKSDKKSKKHSSSSSASKKKSRRSSTSKNKSRKE